MADNTQLVNPAGATNADVIRTIDRSSDSVPITAKTQVVQLDVGGEANESLVTAANPLPVGGTFWQATQPVSGTFWQTTQPVSGTFWQATQPVSGTFWQATQPVSGTVTSNQGGAPWTVKPDGAVWTLTGTSANVDVTNTVAISAASLPLPTGAATLAEQQTINTTLGSPMQQTGGTIAAVTSITNPVAVTGTFWQATQPVSGTFWQVTQPVSGTFWQATQPVSGTFWQTTQPISAAALPLPANAAQETGGNLAAINTLLTYMQRMVDLQVQTLAVLQATRLQEAATYGASVEPFDVMTDTLN